MNILDFPKCELSSNIYKILGLKTIYIKVKVNKILT